VLFAVLLPVYNIDHAPLIFNSLQGMPGAQSLAKLWEKARRLAVPVCSSGLRLRQVCLVVP